MCEGRVASREMLRLVVRANGGEGTTDGTPTTDDQTAARVDGGATLFPFLPPLPPASLPLVSCVPSPSLRLLSPQPLLDRNHGES